MESTRRLAGQVYSDVVWVRQQLAQAKTYDVALSIFNNLMPVVPVWGTYYLSQLLPSHLMPQGMLISIGGSCLFSLRSLAKAKRVSTQLLFTTFLIANGVGLVAAAANRPLGQYAVVVDGFILLTSALGAGYAFSKGIKCLFKAAHQPTASERIGCLFAGALSTVIALHDFAFTCQVALNYVRVLNLSDLVQRAGILKQRGIATYGEKKACRAVLIEGKLSRLMGDRPTWAGENLYHHCHTRTYRVKSSHEFCQALRDSMMHFKGEIDILVQKASVLSGKQWFSGQYGFSANATEIGCINASLAEGGQVVLLGSNTDKLIPPFAQSLAGRLITGFWGRCDVVHAPNYYRRDGVLRFVMGQNSYPIAMRSRKSGPG